MRRLQALLHKCKPSRSTTMLLRHACCSNNASGFLWKCAERRSQVFHLKFFASSKAIVKLISGGSGMTTVRNVDSVSEERS
jgi:hypothetical protein